MTSLNRRDFIKYTSLGLSAIVVGSKLPWLSDEAYAGVTALNFTITDAIKEMATHNAVNTAECYFWVFNEASVPAEVPAPTIIVTQGASISITVTNNLDEPHRFSIPDIGFTTGDIAPNGGVFTGTLNVPANSAGTYLYYDDRNAPVNRVMGLHGAFVVMPDGPSGTQWTPYDSSTCTPQVQQLFNEFGTADHWPGLAWEEGDPVTLTPGFRQYIWICCQASMSLFRDVGRWPAGQDFPADEFVRRFTSDAFSNNSHDIDATSDIPQYFTIGGQSGHYCHNNPVITPMARVGEPVLVRILNAGLMTHSMHLHCNHYFVISVDGVIQGTPVGGVADNPTLLNPGIIWVDTFTLNPPGYPSSRYDMVIPFMRAPDVPNERGIGRGGSGDEAMMSVNGKPTWPPVEEFDVFMPNSGDCISSVDGTVIPNGLRQRESPLCFPMHDHSEPSQTTQGGNYNTALISGMYIIGDRNIVLPRYNIDDLAANPGGNPGNKQLPPQTFPMDEDFAMMLGLNQDPQVLCYGVDQAVRNGVECSGKDTDLDSQADRPAFPVVP